MAKANLSEVLAKFAGIHYCEAEYAIDQLVRAHIEAALEYTRKQSGANEGLIPGVDVGYSAEAGGARDWTAAFEGARRMYETAWPLTSKESPWEKLRSGIQGDYVKAYCLAHDEGARSRDGEVERLKGDRVRAEWAMILARGKEKDAWAARDVHMQIADERKERIRELEQERDGLREYDREARDRMYEILECDGHRTWEDDIQQRAIQVMRERAEIKAAKEAAERKVAALESVAREALDESGDASEYATRVQQAALTIPDELRPGSGKGETS